MQLSMVEGGVCIPQGSGVRACAPTMAEHHFIREMGWMLIELGAFPVFSKNS